MHFRIASPVLASALLPTLIAALIAAPAVGCGGEREAYQGGPASALGTPGGGGGDSSGGSGGGAQAGGQGGGQAGGGQSGGGLSRAALAATEALDPELRGNLDTCLRRTLDQISDPQIYYACHALGPHLVRVRAALAPRCEAGDGPACFLLFSVDRRGFGWGHSVLLFAPPCGRTSQCLEWLTLATTAPFAGFERAELHQDADPAPLDRACEGGHADACIARARTPDAGSHAAELFVRACELGRTSACAESARRLHMLRGAHGRADALLRPACERGDRVACSNLGLMVERGMVGAPNLEEAGALLRRACGDEVEVPEGEQPAERWLDLLAEDRDRFAGCVNLVYYAESHSREARPLRIEQSAARQVLRLACEGDVDGGHACAALSLMRRRRGEPRTTALRQLACDRGVARLCHH